MNENHTMLTTILERMRANIDDPDVSAKYPDDFLIRHCIAPAMVDVLARLDHNADNPVVVRHSLEIVEDQMYYQLPPCIQTIWRIVMVNQDDMIIGDWFPRGQFNPFGPGWSIEGNTLTVDPKTGNNIDDMYILYVPNGDFYPHYSSTGALLSFAADGVTHKLRLPATATLGAIDKRENSYDGAIFRAVGSYVEERIISRYYFDSNYWWVELRRPLTRYDATTGTVVVPYEIAPAGSQPLYEAISLQASIKLGTYRKISDTHMNRLILLYRASMKTIKDNLSGMQGRTGKYFAKDTIDNPSYSLLY